MIKGYHTDNGILNTYLLKKKKNIRFSGSGALHQNGAAECAIKTVVTMARAMLMHAVLRCTEEKNSTDLWPTAMDYAVWVYNRTPDMQLDYPQLKYGQGQDLSQCQKPSETVTFGVFQHMF